MLKLKKYIFITSAARYYLSPSDYPCSLQSVSYILTAGIDPKLPLIVPLYFFNKSIPSKPFSKIIFADFIIKF